jgi:hypothetical protein
MNIGQSIKNHRKLIFVCSGIMLLVVIALAAAYFCWFRNQPVLANYPEFIKDNVVLICNNDDPNPKHWGSTICLSGHEFSSYLVAGTFYNSHKNLRIVKDVSIKNSDLQNNNLIIIGTPQTNSICAKLFELTGDRKIDSAYPGYHNGLAELMKNPWNENYYVLLVTGSDYWGLRAIVYKLTGYEQFLFTPNAIANWEQSTGITFPIDTPEKAKAFAYSFVSTKKYISAVKLSSYTFVEYIKKTNITDESNRGKYDYFWVYTAGIKESLLILDQNYYGFVFDAEGNLLFE